MERAPQPGDYGATGRRSQPSSEIRRRVDAVTDEPGPNPRNRDESQATVDPPGKSLDGKGREQPVTPILEAVNQTGGNTGVIKGGNRPDPT
ncbi:MAG: hypothetical protein WDZ96_00040 [Acidimicrobiia bacterium]